ncbi:hypothetical protein H8K38_11420 [Undibacterium sp. FT79W]|uniref:hypothetical protein n=1 Tax=Undibacterium sp. FT79W TaxID=2762296 RepID=UPI00164B3A78|nr:hypothetical protein [Undibacterium sp. FT79W]MBC3878423.1 hypothetical protein [Undibacterium sp. FT79W]
MSCTQGWDFLIATTNYSTAVRELIEFFWGNTWSGNVSEETITTDYGTATVNVSWTFTFKLSSSNISIDPNNPNCLNISVPFSGSFTGPIGIVSDPSAQSQMILISSNSPALVSASCDVSKIVIKSEVLASTSDSETVNYSLSIQSGVFTDVQVTQISDTDAAALQLFFSTALTELVGQSFNLGSREYELNSTTQSYIAPTLFNFITIYSNNELVVCGMLSNHDAPTGSWEATLASSPQMILPSDSNLLFAVSDSLILNEVSQLVENKVSANAHGRINSSVNGSDPAVLEVTVTTRRTDLSLQVSFASNNFLTQELYIDGIMDASEGWNGSVTVTNNDADGTQTISFNNVQAYENGPSLDQNDPRVIDFKTCLAWLMQFSPLHGTLMLDVGIWIEEIISKIINAILNGLNSALTLSRSVPYTPSTTIIKVVGAQTVTLTIDAPIQTITLNSGIIVVSNLQVTVTTVDSP